VNEELERAWLVDSGFESHYDDFLAVYFGHTSAR
jgi:hypothetical protein